MLHRLLTLEVSEQTVSWFNLSLSLKSQCVHFEDSNSRTLSMTKGVPQRLVLRLLTYSSY